MKKFAVLIGMLVVFTCDTSAWAELLSGSLSTSTSGGAVGINAFTGTPILTWSLDKVGDDWKYTYTFSPSGAGRGAAFLDLETLVNPNIDSWSISYVTTPSSSYTPNPPTMLYQTGIDETANKAWTITDGGVSKADVYVTTTIDGLIFSLPSITSGGKLQGAGGAFNLTILSKNAPMWGDFYADGGSATNHNGYLMAYNSSFDSTNRPTFNLASAQAGEIPLGYIPTLGAPVPIPPAFFLFGSGLSGLFFLKRRRLSA